MNGDVADLNLPATPQQAAAAKLETLSADPAWREKIISGSGQETAEFHKLMSAKVAEDQLDQVISGEAKSVMLETVTDGQLTTHNQIMAASWLSEVGIEPEAIKQAFRGGEVSRQEHIAAANLKKDLLANSDFQKKYLAGDREAVRQITLLNIIATCGIKNEKAAA